MTTDQIRMVRGMLAKSGLMGYKNELVLSHSGGRTNSLTAMTYGETQSLVKYLKAYQNEPASPAEKMRNKILSLAHEMKWHKPGTRKINMTKVDDYCMDKMGYTLDDMPYLELCKAVTMTEAVHLSYLKGI